MWKQSSFEASDRFEYLQALVTEFQDTDNEALISALCWTKCVMKFLYCTRHGSDFYDFYESSRYLELVFTSEAKEQVLANLANFAYDPKNMEHLRTLQVTDLFLDMLSEENENFVEFGMGGLCNLSMDPECRDIILQSDGISLVTSRLSSRREETVLSAITTLMNLLTASSRSEITAPAILHCMLRFSLSESPRLRNLAAVFLQDCCSEEQLVRAQQQMEGQQTAVGIPLPADS